MRRLLQRAREMPDERKVKLATSVAGIVTIAVLFIWVGSFLKKIDTNPASVASALEDRGALDGMVDQINALIGEIQSVDFKPPETGIESDLDQAN